MTPLRVAAPSRDTLIVIGTALVVGAGAFAAAAGASRLWLLLFAGGALLPYAPVALHHVRRLLLAAVIVDLVLQLDVNFGYREEVGQYGAEGGLNVSVTTFAVAGLFALWAAERSRPRSDAARLVLAPARPLFVYVGISALSIAVASEPVLGGYMLALLLQTLLLFVYIVTTVRTRAEVMFVMSMLMAALLLEGTLMLASAATGVGVDVLGRSAPAAPPGEPAASAAREAGTLGSPNTAAIVLELLLPAALGLLLAPVGRRLRTLAGAAFGVGLVALILTGSRGGWAAFVLSCAILAVVATRRGLVRPRIALGTVVAMLVIALPLAGTVAQRVTGDDEGAAYSRVPLARLALRIVEDRPLLGVGLNNVVVAIPAYAGPEFSGEWLYNIHNKYLLVASEAGLLALGAFVWFLLASIGRGLRCVRSRDPVVVALAAGLTAGIVGQMVHMSVDIFAGRGPVQVLWVFAALLAVLASLERSQSGVAGQAPDVDGHDLGRSSEPVSGPEARVLAMTRDSQGVA